MTATEINVNLCEKYQGEKNVQPINTCMDVSSLCSGTSGRYFRVPVVCN